MTRIGQKALSELSDAELRVELERRRRARGTAVGSSHSQRTPSSPRRDDGSIPGWKVREDHRKWYRALELEDGATVQEVEASYQRLLARYDPDRHREDPARFRDATKLAVGLGEAYYGLRDHLTKS